MTASSTICSRRRGTKSLQNTPWVQSGFVTALRQNERRRSRDGDYGWMVSCLPRLFVIVSACLVLARLRSTAVDSIGTWGGRKSVPDEEPPAAATMVTMDGVAYEFCGGCLYHATVGSCEQMAERIRESRSSSMEDAMRGVITLADHCAKAATAQASPLGSVLKDEKKYGGVAIAKEQARGSRASDGGGWETPVTLDGVTYEFCRECLYHANVGSCEVRATWLIRTYSLSVEEAMRGAIQQAKECGKESEGLVTVDGASYEFCPNCEFKGREISCQQRADWLVKTYHTPLRAAMESAVRQRRECGKARGN